MPRWQRSAAGNAVTSSPSNRMEPWVGGIGTLWGPVLGAVVLIPLTELTRSYIGGSGRGVDLIVYGTLIVLISLARPEGLVGLFAPRRKEPAR